MKININLISKRSFSFNYIKIRKRLNTNKNSLINMNYLEDPLLKSKKLVLNNDVLNLYSALVRINDFGNERSLNSIPYLTGKIVDEIKPLISEDLIKNLGCYMQQKILKRTVKFWINNNIIPFPLVRIIFLANKNPIKQLSEYIKLIDFVTNNQKINYSKLPIFFNDLLSSDLIYFYGYLLGDGCISKERLIKLCDGHQNPVYTEYSLRFLESIQKYIKNKFNLPSKLTKLDNKYELVLTSKCLCRFFKFFYNFKKDEGFITKPKIIKDNKEKNCIFYRGLFDADAGIKVKDKFLVLKCADEKFIQLCKKDFKSYGVITSEIAYDNLNIPYFKIYSQNLYKYAQEIGFSHPRKKEILVEHLKKGCLIKKLNSVNTQNLIDNKYYDLSKIQDLRIKGISNIFKKYRQQLGTQQHVANLLYTFRENVKRWENGTDSVPFGYYLKLMRLNGTTITEVLNDISKRKVLFGKGKLKQFTKLPVIFDKSHLDLFQYLNPTTNKTIVKAYGIDNRDLDRKELFNKIETFFGIKVRKDAHSYVIFSVLVSNFLDTFYDYINSWDPMKDEEINRLMKKWDIL